MIKTDGSCAREMGSCPR